MKPLLSIFLILLFSPAKITAQPSGSQPLEIFWIDSEGGGSTLIVTPDRESILIDSGNPGGRDSARIEKVLKEVAKVDQLDHLVTTHFHMDHFGGAAELAAKLNILHVWDKGVPEQNPDNNPGDTSWRLKIKPYRELNAGHRHVLKAGDQIPLKRSGSGPALKLTCLAANQQFVKGGTSNALCGTVAPKAKDSSDNANSLVLVLEFGDFRFFDGGDLTWNMEQELACPDRVGTVDLFQVNHHGLDVSNNPLLIQALSPTVTVMNNGPRKGAHPEVLKNLRACKSIEAMYQVHRNVTHEDANPKPDFIANHEEKCEANYIRAVVDASGKEFRIEVPSTGHKATYKVKTKPAR